MGEGTQMEGERKGKNLGIPKNGRKGGRMGKGTWACIKAGKMQSHRQSQTITRAQQSTQMLSNTH